MRIYLDLCSIQRPLDLTSQVRIQLEAEAVIGIISLSAEEKVELVSSAVLELENGKNPYEDRRTYAQNILSQARMKTEHSDDIKERAKELTALGIKAFDALHLASAESAAVDYFCTCYDRLLKRTRQITTLSVKVVTPIALIQELLS